MISIAYAMGQGGAPSGQGGGFAAFIPLILMFVIFYFLLIRPQQKKAKEHREMIANLKRGDKIITSGGIYGTITGIDDNTMTIEIAEKVRVKLNRANVAGLSQSAASQQPAKNTDSDKDKTS